MSLLLSELSALYSAYRQGEADPLPELAIQYADYAQWQRSWLEGGQLDRQIAYWRQRLSGAPSLLSLPTDRARPAQQDYSGALVPVHLDKTLSDRLEHLSRRHGVTLYMTLLASWGAVLGRLAGQTDVVIGSPVAGRNRSEIEGLIGFFVNTLALRLDLEEMSIAQLLAQAKDTVVSAQAHQDLPFEQVVDIVKPDRSLSHTPLFQA
ncbi:condensation domain-containing protein, partial [Denitromonas iodatirespirans]|uniref:condensation domain-containing protein n=1 Tax=Denitromonas iodatirespirans TaxID=2795389 RepID=UPI002714EF03